MKVYRPLTFEEHFRVGSLYEAKGLHEKALLAYAHAQKIRPDDSSIYFGLGNVKLNLNKLAEAEKNYLKAIELDQEVGIYYNNLAWTYIQMGLLDVAKMNLNIGMGWDPDRRYIYLDTLGVIEEKMENYDEAERHFKEAALVIPLEEVSGLIEVYTHLRNLYLLTGRGREAGEVDESLMELLEDARAIKKSVE
ncbi:MAG: hypothetical protein KAT46_01570 [Deltaproteobacteria bacterium]|nr:hypothetical protein [Deltaproteobacteria bacterium]